MHTRTQGRADAQAAAVRDVSGLLGVTPGSASLLLRRFRWNQEDLLSRYVEDPQRVCAEAGVPVPGAHTPGVVVSARGVAAGDDDAECAICREQMHRGGGGVTALACGHVFCDACWTTYLEGRIQEGDTAIRCPQHKCPLRVPEEVVAGLCSPQMADRFREFVRKSFVEEGRNTMWCPHPGCTFAVDTAAAAEETGAAGGEHAGGPALSGGVFVTCGGGHTFCVACKCCEVHAPAPCDLVRTWQKKCDDDSETMNWLSAHTQDCPQCKCTIEKNGGCNHMTCRGCKWEFCWVCGGPWAKHGDSYYTCSKYDADAQKNKESNKAASRAALERYLHHFHRYMNHDASRKLETKTRARAEDTIRALQVANPHAAQWGDVSFVAQGVEVAIQCRTVLKWTYVLAFFLQDKSPEKELFCCLQGDLEARTERLSELLEKPAATLLQPGTRAEILALAGAATHARKELLKGAPPVGAAAAPASDLDSGAAAAQ